MDAPTAIKAVILDQYGPDYDTQDLLQANYLTTRILSALVALPVEERAAMLGFTEIEVDGCIDGWSLPYPPYASPKVDRIWTNAAQEAEEPMVLINVYEQRAVEMLRRMAESPPQRSEEQG